MSHTRAIAGNTAVQVAGKFVGNLLGVATIAVMTRSLGRDGYGAFTTAISFLQFFGILVDFGLTLTMTRLISDGNHDESRMASNVLTLRIVSGAVFFGLAPLVALAFPYPPLVKTAIAIGALSFFAMSASQVLGGIFQKHLSTSKTALADVCGRLTLLACVALAAARHANVLAFVGAVVLGNLVQFSISLAYARKITRLRFAFDAAVWNMIIRESWPIGVSIAFNLIYLKGDIVVLSLWRSQAEVGLYGAAYKVLDVVTVIPMIFMGLVLPILTATWAAGDAQGFVRKLNRAFDALSLLALPLMLGGLVTASDLMRLVAGEDFAASGVYMAVLMIGGAAVFWGALFGHAVVAMGMQRRMIAAYATDAAISIALYIWAIPRFGALGAAWVTVFSEVFIMLLTGTAVLGKLKRLPELSTFAKALVASLVMAAAVWLMPFHVLVRIVIGAGIYGFLLLAFGAVTRETLASFRKTSVAPQALP